jgi:hypothetical protein
MQFQEGVMLCQILQPLQLILTVGNYHCALSANLPILCQAKLLVGLVDAAELPQGLRVAFIGITQSQCLQRERAQIPDYLPQGCYEAVDPGGMAWSGRLIK